MIRCMLIDDDIDDQEIFTVAAHRTGEEVFVVAVSTCGEGLRLLTNGSLEKPDYIFIDLNMPLQNGKECLQNIREIEALSSIPIFMHSPAIDNSTISEISQLGATGFVKKPNSIAVLTAYLLEIFTRASPAPGIGQVKTSPLFFERP